ncbi:MAG: hypothetical protein EOO45_04810 [Flavobacterium sp.]|nr:MAG: hypothetical protein EOO45_04810 [Flavobacterium sp.]
MKNNLLKFYFLAFLLVSNVVAFAQSTDTADGTLEDNDLPPTSISPKLIYLALVGIAFAFYYFSKSRKEQLN